MILVEPTDAAGGGPRPTIFLAYKCASQNGSTESGDEPAALGETCIIEWAAPWEERYLQVRILGVVSHVIIPDVGIAALDLDLDGPDDAEPSFKVLIDAVRLLGTMMKMKQCRWSVAGSPEAKPNGDSHGLERVSSD
ncbi:MAG TPA: hypothetical protein VJX67_10630 [Blastocatellia bacterium]|nr:hypothetical protein [Blastocatellia bacterium]